ncbi:protein TPX2 [Rutidosis leptorrhynchoides]|uniref:protein TPX2 n=1 Tax=Rutidosis leptorrhynchoides TaxID=125765 RepID=UPI003A99BF6B
MEDDNSSGNTAVEFMFTAVEIDLDYEFDTPRFFDFTREESVDEAREAEMWFDSAQSCPPSPFAVRLLSREQNESTNPSTSSEGFGNCNMLESVSNAVQATEDFTMDLSKTDADGTNRGVPLDVMGYLHAFQKQNPTSSIQKDSTRNGIYKSKTRKPSCPRASTLMKPTASQLAKQNPERLMDNFRLQKVGNNSGVESQAAKRQKLEGGHLCKVTDTKQQASYVHKAPKREGRVEGSLGHGRLRITVPIPPDLATAQRAQRIRKKDESGNEHVVSRAPGFRARLLNRKIFEAPSLLHQKSIPQLPEFQEFHLKTTERALQNTTAVPSTSRHSSKVPHKPNFAFSAESSSRESRGYIFNILSLSLRPHVPDAAKQETVHKFKALPLNKKIFSSKGDLGVFRSSKRETTVTTAFNFQTEKRGQHVPPVDLFNKLSLASESGSQLHRPTSRPPSIFTKGLKENRVCSVIQQSEVSTPKFGSKQFNNNKVISEGPPLSTINRNLGLH